jgi:hypothetical protein
LAQDDSQSTSLIHPITKAEYKTVFSSQRGFNRLHIVSTGFADDTVKFDAMGAPDNPGSIRVQAGSQVYVISVAVATGKVTVAPG